MKLDSPEFHSLFTPELEVVISMFKKYDYEIKIAGGAVRDLLMGIRPTDVDLATVAKPETMTDMFTRENIRILNKRGEKHGTVTCRINDKQNFEITTLRVDVVCDGRRAEVQYTNDWFKDANRRDLTINSMFLDFSGTVYDFFGGIEDVQKRRVAFVGDPALRIQEDYLRILRYFRFYGRIAEGPNNHEESTLRAIKENAKGLQGKSIYLDISGERIWFELKKIVVGNFAADIISTMANCDVTSWIGLQNEINIEEFRRVYENSRGLSPDPITVLSALLCSVDDIIQLNHRLKLSNRELMICDFIMTHRNDLNGMEVQGDINNSPEIRRKFQDLTFDFINRKPTPESKERVFELLKYLGLPQLLEGLRNWEAPRFPVNGVMLLQKGAVKTQMMNLALGYLFDHWQKSNYEMTAEQLMNLVTELPPLEKLKAVRHFDSDSMRLKRIRRS